MKAERGAVSTLCFPKRTCLARSNGVCVLFPFVTRIKIQRKTQKTGFDVNAGTRTEYRETLTLTRNCSQYTIKQHNNLLAKRNLVGQQSTSVIEKEVNSIVSGPCYGKPFLFVCWRQIHSVVSYVGFK